MNEKLANVIATARCLRAAQKAYMVFREHYPATHVVREQAGKLVERAARELDNAIDLLDL